MIFDVIYCAGHGHSNNRIIWINTADCNQFNHSLRYAIKMQLAYQHTMYLKRYTQWFCIEKLREQLTTQLLIAYKLVVINTFLRI